MKSSRFINSGACDGTTNMAVDEALLNTYQKNLSSPILRIYGWSKPSFSFGYSQNPKELFNLDLCKEKNIPLVRRPTGGGIIFHNDELTYSIVLSTSDLEVKLNVKGTLRYMTSFLIRVYRDLGKNASFSIETNTAAAATTTIAGIADLCFARSEEYDIVIDGKKIGGNAQKRKKHLVLQHGSIPFSFEKEKIAPFLKNKTLLNNVNTTCINEISKGRASFTQLSDIIKNAFSAHFSTTLKESSLSEKERIAAEQLKQEKYNQAQWNLYRQDI
ncbi:MAG: biotin/lipoate A/B protein ligase family protein [Candidatus Omnitrophota bacterium]